MALRVHPGYRGLANIPSVGQVRFSDASITARQEVNAPDLIMGDWDHDAYVYGPIEVGGTISGPVTETFVCGSPGCVGCGGGSGSLGLATWAVQRTGNCGELNTDDITLYYYCGGATIPNTRTFTGMYANSLNFSCAAGDIANFSIDLMGRAAGAWSSTATPHFTGAEKLVTWDKVNVTITAGSGDCTPGSDVPSYATGAGSILAYSNFDFTVSNNLEMVYALNAGSGGVGSPDLFPYDIVPGLRTITGSLSVYDTPEFDGFDTWDDYIAAGVSTLTFDIGGLSMTMKVRLHRIEPASTVGPIISSVGFTGVSHQTGLPWV